MHFLVYVSRNHHHHHSANGYECVYIVSFLNSTKTKLIFKYMTNCSIQKILPMKTSKNVNDICRKKVNVEKQTTTKRSVKAHSKSEMFKCIYIAIAIAVAVAAAPYKTHYKFVMCMWFIKHHLKIFISVIIVAFDFYCILAYCFDWILFSFLFFHFSFWSRQSNICSLAAFIPNYFYVLVPQTPKQNKHSLICHFRLPYIKRIYAYETRISFLFYEQRERAPQRVTY